MVVYMRNVHISTARADPVVLLLDCAKPSARPQLRKTVVSGSEVTTVRISPPTANATMGSSLEGPLGTSAPKRRRAN